jgi:antitoxin component of RelBE/YafQ-DinJ toxin-antitoxin module
MKAEYDFSKGERGKFYNAEATFKLPIYLEPDVNEVMSRLAEENGIPIETLVNEWLRANLKLLETVKRTDQGVSSE